jgi:hypothetical protein
MDIISFIKTSFNLLTPVAAGITAWSTFQQRKDNLYQRRWECYQEITKYIRDTYEKKCIHYANQIPDLQDSLKKQDFLKKCATSRYPKELTLEEHNLISQIKHLFNDEIANLIQEFMFDYSLELISESTYFYFIDEPQNIDGKYTLSWLPSSEFERKFEKYLKLK